VHTIVGRTRVSAATIAVPRSPGQRDRSVEYRQVALGPISWFVERRREKPEPSSNHVGMLAIIALVPGLLLLSGCMLVGPDDKAPPLQAPAGFANKVGNQC
jgi:hypothetical protein